MLTINSVSTGNMVRGVSAGENVRVCTGCNLHVVSTGCNGHGSIILFYGQLVSNDISVPILG